MSITRPDAPQLDAVLGTVAEIRHMEGELVALRERLAREARALAEISDKRLRIEAGFYAYWFAPEAHAKDIALGATGRPHPGKLLKLAGAVSVGVPCDRCGDDLPIRSRNHMKEVLQEAGKERSSSFRYRLVCVPCQNALQEESIAEIMAEVMLP